MIGTSLHYLGDQTDARHHIERMLASYTAPVHRPDTIRFQFDQRVTARATLPRILWLQGFPNQAMRTVQRNVEEALAIDHALSLCNALADAACPIALLIGDLDAAERFATDWPEPERKRHLLRLWLSPRGARPLPPLISSTASKMWSKASQAPNACFSE
jgi:hypothetical protein